MVRQPFDLLSRVDVKSSRSARSNGASVKQFAWRGLVALSLVASALCANAQIASSGWPKFHGGLTNSGLATGSGATNVLKWSYTTGNAIVSSPAVGPDGTVYVGSTDENVYAFNGSTGTVTWTFPTSAAVVSSPAIGTDGTIYVGSKDGNLYAINGSTGGLKWMFEIGAAVESSPTIGADGTVYVGADNGSICAINGSTGTQIWAFKTNGNVVGSPAVATDGSVVVGSDNGNVYEFNGAVGSVNWIFTAGAPVESSPSIAPNGTVYVGSDNGSVFAINGSTGAPIWEQHVFAQTIKSSPAVGPDGTVYVSTFSYPGYVYALSGSTGTILWNFTTGSPLEASPAIGADGTLYIGGLTNTGSGAIFAINGSTGVQQWEYLTGGTADLYSSPAIGSDGTIYVGANDGTLFSLIGVHLQSLGLTPYTVAGGISSTGTVTLSAPAPAGGEVVLLSSNNPNATVPTSVTVPAGQTSATFSVTTLAVDIFNSATITANFGVPLNATLSVVPAALLTMTFNPTSVIGSLTSVGTVALTGPAGPSGLTILVSSNNSAASVPESVSFAPGQSFATFNITTSVVTTQTSADITVSLGTQSLTGTVTVLPASLSAMTLNPTKVQSGISSLGTVSINGPAGPGGVVVNLSSNSPAATVGASVTIPAGQTFTTFLIATTAITTTTTATTATITASLNGQVQNATLTVVPLTVVAITFSPASVLGGYSSVATVALSGTAPTGGATVSLSSSSSAATVPATVTIAAGQTFGTFTITTSAVNAAASAVISAKFNTQTASATLSISPTAIASVSLSPAVVSEGNSTTATVTLNNPAGASGMVVTLKSSSNLAKIAPSIKIAAGKTSGSVAVTSSNVTVSTLATITATLNGSSQAVVLTMVPLGVASVSFSPGSVNGGTPTTGTVTLTGPAPLGGSVINLSSNVTGVKVPLTITMAQGLSSGTFSANTAPVNALVVATITARLGTSYQTASITVNPSTLVAIKLSPSTVTGGSNSTGTVVLSGTAPAGGLVVKLSSDITSATVPASVTVSAGSSSASFKITTSIISAPDEAYITASFHGSYETATLTINPPTITSLSLNPSTVVGGKSSTGTVTIGSAAPAGGLIISLTSLDSTAAVPDSITIAAGKTSGTFTITTSSVTAKTPCTISATQGFNTKTVVLTVTK